jgi:hypothetical protein
MTHKGVSALISAGVGAAVVLVAAPAGAQTEDLPLSVEPTSGPIGTEVTVSGEDCLNEDGPGEVDVELFFEDEEEPAVFPADEVLEDGSWSLVLASTEEDPPGIYTFTATCFVPGSEEVIAEYEFVEFELTAPTTAPTTPPTNPSTAPPPAQAPPAVPVVDEPDFTG